MQETKTPEKLVIALGPKGLTSLLPHLEASADSGGISTSVVPLQSGEMLTRAFNDPFDLAELSLSNYIIETERESCAYIALPVYLSRAFPHGDFYIRRDQGILNPRDLIGKRVGIRSYHHTAYVWARALLEHGYDVAPSQVLWCVETETGQHASRKLSLPADINIEGLAAGVTLSDALERGEVDAVISARPLQGYSTGSRVVSRLFGETAEENEGFFERNDIFPILHVLGIRKTLLAKKPGLAQKIHHLAAASSKSRNDLHLVTNDRATLDAFFSFHYEQGLSTRRFRKDELFLAF